MTPNKFNKKEKNKRSKKTVSVLQGEKRSGDGWWCRLHNSAPHCAARGVKVTNYMLCLSYHNFFKIRERRKEEKAGTKNCPGNSGAGRVMHTTTTGFAGAQQAGTPKGRKKKMID